MKKIELGQAITILANVGVIAGIVFLGYEMRQNTQVARQEAYNSFTQSVTDLNTTIVANPQLAGLIARVARGERREALTPSEQMQVDLLLVGRMRILEGLYQSFEEGIADEGYFQNFLTGQEDSPYFQEVWSTFRATFDPAFVEYIEARFQE